MKTRLLIAVLVTAVAGEALAQQQPAPVRRTVRSSQTFTIAPGGSFVLDNPIGNVEIVGAADVTDVQAAITTILTAPNDAALQEARRQSGMLVGGDTRTRVVRTAISAYHEKKPWSAIVHWTVRVPRSVNVRIVSGSSGRVRVADVIGNVHVKNFNGNVTLSNVTGATFVESVNGSIVYTTAQPRANVVLSTVNGHVTATVAPTADFRWVAEAATGDIRTNMMPRGKFAGATFVGNVNAPGGPTITMNSLMGDLHLLASGSSAATSQSVKQAPPMVASLGRPQSAQTITPANSPRLLRLGTVKQLTHNTTLGDVKVNEVRGDANVTTGAGEVHLGSVSGSATVRSLGGPLTLGEVLGPLNASTRAGDILVDSTRRGGTIATDGGTIRLLYTGGPTRLTSGGGDIIVRQAAAPVTAETASGDISITIDPASTSEVVQAKTGKGNIVLNVSPRFAADVEATILTTAPNADTFLSDIPGLAISREQVGGRTRVRATGKLNGGGQKVVLQTTGGDIRIATARVGPTVVKPR